LVLVTLAALFMVPRAAWVILSALVLAIGAWEWGGLARLALTGRVLYALTVTATAYGLMVAPEGTLLKTMAYGSATVFWLVFAPLWLWERPVFATPVVPLVAGAVSMVPAFFALIDMRDSSPMVLLAVLALVWISDSAAYFTGNRYGRRKLAPEISPGKTWEGLYGALAAVSIYAIGWLLVAGGPQPALLRRASLGPLWFVLAMLGLALAGVAGDLLESQMKRQAGVKDSGSLLPGHGGILDRIDALLPVLPLAALLFLP
jgi:phosphatidate cytidylyltransferase